MRVLLTGASGFVGRAVLKRLCEKPGVEVVAASRRPLMDLPRGAVNAVVGDFGAQTSWEEALVGVDCVVHAAARVHVMHDTASDPLAAFRAVNVAGTVNLAQQAAKAGARRFVFISSIKVNGERTFPGRPFTPDDAPAPADPYGVSKLEAERALRALSARTGLEVVVIRPPLVYGPGVKANFLSMMRWLRKGVPLPLGAIHNRRSLVALGNLVDLIVTCLQHPNAANQIFLVSDGEDLSTTELLRRMSAALGRPARLLPVPAGALELAAAILGKRSVAQRLCGSLQLDIGTTRQRLGWTPPVTVADALQVTARDFLEHRQK